MEWTDILQFSYQNVWIIALLPLVAFILILLDRFCERLEYKELFPRKEHVAYLVIGATALGLIQSLLLFNWSLNTDNPIYVFNTPWLVAGSLELSFGWLVDKTSILMLLVVTSVSLLIQIYTMGYMEKDPGYRRFFAYLALFNFSMLGLVLSTNLFQIYIFWELVGLCSYLLIGFWFDRPSAAKAAKKAFVMNRIGDSLLLIGIVAFLLYSFNFWKSSNIVFLSFENLADASQIVLFQTGPYIFALIAICIFFGAIAKSAQFPLHTWLPDAMEGPTPISALIHAATMVAAGVYLVARAYPIFVTSPMAMNFMAWIGVITVFITATIAVSQLDIKRVLAYSTCSQLGYMIMAMGLGAYSAGLFHLTTHAFFKAMLFLCAGAVIHGLHGEQDMRFMGGLRKYMPITSWTYLIGAASISGLLLSGFWSKDMILGAAFERITTEGGSIDYNILAIFILAFVSAGLTAFYMFRSYFMTFEGEYKGHAKPHESPKVMTYPLIVLAVPSFILGFLLSGINIGPLHLPDFTAYVYFVHHAAHHIDIGTIILSLLIALAGTAGAAGMYWNKHKSGDSRIFKEKLPLIHKISFNKWYFDEMYGWFTDRVFMLFSKFCSVFDKYFVDEVVNLVAQMTKESGATLKYIQNGKVQFSALVMYTGLVIIALVLVLYSMY
jgi:NAD(P)H-quinone oxidoreductase subunit 5